MLIMKTRLCLLFSAFALLFSSVYAGEVQRKDAEQVAKNFIYEKMHQYNDGNAFEDVKIINAYVRSEDGQVIYYAFDFAHGGYVIVSGEDVYTPVIGYSYNGVYTTINAPYAYTSFMQGYADMIDHIRVNQLEADMETKDEWSHLLTADISSLNTLKDNRDVSPLTSALWNQESPYNILCPEKNGLQCTAGCVATAMAMVMYYYRYPINGTGSFSYIPSPSIGTLSANFGDTYYAWEGMKDVIDGTYPIPIAELQYHCGISVSMNYCSNGIASGASSAAVPNRLQNFWRYTDAQYIEKEFYTLSSWINILKGEIDMARPLYYSGYSTSGGHAFVCDGYQGDDFHFNFGWSGYQNGYYSLSSVNGYNQGQGCVTDFYPSDPDYPYHADEDYIITHQSGSFTDGSGPIEDYLNNQTATWLIDPQTEQDSVSDIKLNFTHFDLDAGDFVRVYDGENASAPMLGEFTGSSLPSQVTSSDNKLFISLETNGSGTAPGFKAEFESSSPKWCAGMTEFNEPTGTITDGSGSFYYHNAATCMFLIEPEYAGTITLYFNAFETEEDNDILSVYDGNTKIAEFSGSELPDPVEATSGSMFITWTTNTTVNEPGWEVYYEINNVGISEDQVFGDMYIYPNPANDHLNINFNSDVMQSFDIKLMNMTGQVIYTERVENHAGQFDKVIDLSGFANGVYILSLNGTKGIVTEKIIIR